jgi:hypothetical protein
VGAIAQLHALANDKAPCPGARQAATIYLDLFVPGFLAVADLRRTREMLRKRLDRAGFSGAIVVGGIEVAWQEKHQRWLLHAQVLAIGVDADAWKQLEAALEGRSCCATPTSSSPTASSSSPITNPDAASSLCLRIASSSSQLGSRNIASKISCSLTALSSGRSLGRR